VEGAQKGGTKMTVARWIRWLALLACTGCGGGGSAPAAGTLSEIKRREVASLPAIGDYLPPLDDGMLEAAPPAGWNVMRRGRTFLVGFAKGKASELPRIVISAGDPPDGSPSTLTEAGAGPFAAEQDKELRTAAKLGKKRVGEYNLPIVLGDTVFIRHVRQATLADAPCVIQSLQTIQNGRLYTVELIAEIEAARAEEYEKSLAQWRDYGYAVAANLKFAGPQEEK
jgi:hypothetical protein